MFYSADDLITLIAKDVGDDWVALGQRLNIEDPDIEKIQDEKYENGHSAYQELLYYFVHPVIRSYDIYDSIT